MSEENKLPPLLADRDVALEKLRPYLLNPMEDYPEPFYLLEYKGVAISPLGGIQAISGQKKNGKTFVLAQLMAAVLGMGEEHSRTPMYLQGLTVPQRTLQYLREKHKDDNYLPSVLYVDTEMEKLNSAKVLRRVHWLAGWDMKEPNPRFNVLWLRGVTDRKGDDGRVEERSHSIRYNLIKLAIQHFNPDVVFIDGIRDIIGDFNDNAESFSLVTDLMALAEKNNICIWNALHMNPRPTNDDESKMRGHLGTELGNKITDTLVSIKHKDSTTGQVTFTVKQNDARGKDMEDWKFEVTDAAGSLGIPRIISSSVLPPTNDEQRLRIEADDYFKLYAWTHIGATYTDLERFLRTKGVTSNRKIKELFDAAMEASIIFKSEKKYHYKGMGGDLPNDKTESIPFEQPDGGEAPF